MGKYPQDYYKYELTTGKAENDQIGFRLQPWKQPPTQQDIEKQDQLFDLLFDGVNTQLQIFKNLQ